MIELSTIWLTGYTTRCSPTAISSLGPIRVRWQRTTFDAVSASNRNLSQSGKDLVRRTRRDHSKRSAARLADVPHGRDPMSLHGTRRTVHLGRRSHDPDA